MGVTIKDVAKLAKVAPSTVSRVLADNPRISEKTKRVVREAMKDLGYHPNLNARSLANKNTQTIGIVMPSSGDKVFQNPFFPEVIRGISTKAHENHYGLYLTTGNTEEEIYDGVVKMVQGRRVDGIILLYSRVDDPLTNYLLMQKFPFTIVGKPYQNIDEITHVDNDNIMASRQATEYLINLGHKWVGFVGGGLELVVTRDRLFGYEQGIKASHLDYQSDYIVHQEFLEKGGSEAIIKLMSLEKPPTALVVADDLMAFGIVNTLHEMGLEVPDDISIVSFNNVLIAELSTPALTSVDINIFQLGYTSASYLLDIIDKKSTEAVRVTIPHHIVERQSCEPLHAKS